MAIKTRACLRAVSKKRASEVGPLNQTKPMETRKHRGGAPRKKESERKDRLVKVMFSTDEYSKLIERKSITKAPNLSAFVRDVCLDKPLRMKPQLTTHQVTVLALLREIRQDVLRIGVNINQSSRRINSTTDYHDLQRDVNTMVEQTSQWDQQLSLLATQFEEEQPRAEPTNLLPNGSQN